MSSSKKMEGDSASPLATESKLSQPIQSPNQDCLFPVQEGGYLTLRIGHERQKRKVAAFQSQRLPAGQHVYEKDASQLPSGVYFYSLSSPVFALTKKALLLK